MSRNQLTLEQTLTLLEAAPRRIAAATDGLPDALLCARPSENEWSANDVLAHLRACADVWGDCIARILAEDRPTIRAIDPRTWMTRTNYPELQFRPSLETYAAQRAELLAVLQALSPEAWMRAATMTGSGKPIDRTALSFAQRLVIHERPHIKQIERVVMAVRP